MLKKLFYKVVYRNGNTREVAEFIREENGEFVFKYLVDNFEFPGLPPQQKEYKSHTLWEPISFRISNTLRNQYPNTPPEELLEMTSGKLVTDHFEFIKQS